MKQRIIIAVISGALVFLGVAFVSRLFVGGSNPNIFSFSRNNEPQPEEVAVLVLGQVGVGQGGQWHFAPELVDTITLFYYQPASDVVNLISLPRDLYGSFGDSQLRINRVVKDDKIMDLLGKMPEITGMQVDKYLIVDLATIKQVVDGLGGIDVNLADEVADPVGSFVLPSGPSHLNGEDAVWLIRNRYAPE